MSVKTMFVLVSLLAMTAPMHASAPTADAPSGVCGTNASDWCPAPAGDACGRHGNAASCRADPMCYGVPYRGESVVACKLDERGFSSNCPTVGCTSRSPRPAAR
jgi:hypothetical protein